MTRVEHCDDDVDATDEDGWRNSSLAKLRELISKDKDQDLLNRNLDDDFLIKFIRASNYDSKAALSRIKTYFAFRVAHPEAFVLPSSVQDVLDDGFVNILKQRGPNGELIIVLKPGVWNSSKYDMNHAMFTLVPFFELHAEDENVQKNGVIMVVDTRGVGLRHLWAESSSHHTLSNGSELRIPIEIKKMNVMYASKVFKGFWNIVKWTVSSNLRNRIGFHGSDLDSLHKEVSKELLPEDLGGTADKETVATKWTDDQLKTLDDQVSKYWKKYPGKVESKSI